jgi:hypothetical protein
MGTVLRRKHPTIWVRIAVLMTEEERADFRVWLEEKGKTANSFFLGAMRRAMGTDKLYGEKK